MGIKLLSGALGAEISGLDLKDTSDENFKKINKLLLEHKVIFFRNQNITSEEQLALGKRFGYVTPGEMLADYFKGDMVRVLTVVVALCFSVPYLGLQLAASG